MSDLKPLCCVSSGNLVAFTATTDLNDSTAKWFTFHVYVVDLNIAFSPFKYDSIELLIVANSDYWSPQGVLSFRRDHRFGMGRERNQTLDRRRDRHCRTLVNEGLPVE